MATELTVVPKVEIVAPNSVAVASNLSEFEAEIKALVAAAPTDPQTDEDFVALDSTAKTLKKAETALGKAEKALTASIPEIQAAFSQIEAIKGAARTDRLHFEKQVKTAKEARKAALIERAPLTLKAYIDGLNATLEYPLPVIDVDFKAATKGRRTITGCEEALGIAVQEAFSKAKDLADRHDVNIRTIRQAEDKYPGIAPDAATLVYELPEVVQATLKTREIEREQAEKRKAEAQESAKAAAQAPSPAPATEVSDVVTEDVPAGAPAPGQGVGDAQRATKPNPVEIAERVARAYNMSKVEAIDFLLSDYFQEVLGLELADAQGL